jgi:thioredoxin 1
MEITDETFAEEVERSQGLAMVDFWASWCMPCRLVAPAVAELAKQYADKLKVGKVDVDANQATAMRFNIRSIPTILFFKDGEVVDVVVGAVPKQALEKKIQQHLS